MPRSVYSIVGHDRASGLNPMNLVRKLAVSVVVLAMVLLGSATLAGALTTSSVSAVTATTTKSLAGQTGAPWVITFTPSSALAASDVINVTLPTGTTFVSPTATAGTTGGLSGTCALSIATSSNVANVTITSCTTYPTAGASANFTINGVTNPATGSYTPTVAINSGQATAEASTSPTLIFADSLAAPVAANTGPGDVSVTYTTDGAPSSVVASYAVSVNGGAGTVGGTNCPSFSNTDPGTSLTGTTHTCSVTGLTAGTTYTFSVAATSASGNETIPTASTSFAANSALAAPAVARAGSGAVNVTFTADGVATLYTVTSSPGGLTCSVGNSTPPSGSQTCTVTGLTNGTSYTFTVTPSGNGTTSTVSPASASIIPGIQLAAPTAILAGGDAAAGAGFSNANISFTADGTATLYTVSTFVASTSAAVSNSCTVANTSTPPTGTQNCTVTDLTNGTGYYFIVTPSGNNTSSTVSAHSNTLTMSAALQAPTTVTAGSGAIKATFFADGTATTYVVASSTGSFSCTVTNATPPTGFQSCTVNGLTNGTSYQFTVTPSGNGTTSTVSGLSTALQATGALATPTVANAGAGAVKVSFVADGVASTYTVNSNTGGFSCFVADTTTPPTGAQSCTVTGLPSDTSYTFTVTPSGNGTTSTVSAPSASITTLSVLAAPSIVATGNGTVTVGFVADGVATTYVVTSTPGNLSCTVSNATPPTGAQNCTVTGLTNGTSYTFTVTPSGNNTTSTTSAASAAAVPGAALATPTVANAGPGNILVTFMADGVATLYTVNTYDVTLHSSENNSCTVANTITPPTGSQYCTVTGLTNGNSYTFTVTPAGNGTASTVSNASLAITPSSALAAPTVSNAGSGAIKVSFVASGGASTYTVTTFDVTTNAAVNNSCIVANTTTAPTGAQSCTVTGLTNGSTYTFTVTPTGNGTSATASAASASIMAGVNFLAAPTVSYSASGAALVTFVTDGVASTYTVQTASGTLAPGASGICVVQDSTTPPTGSQSCVVTGLVNGNAYTFTVTPSGNGTTSLESAPSASFTAVAAVAPSVPQNVTATGGQNSVVVSWSAPANTGGSAITGYEVTATAGNVSVTCGAVAGTATTCTVNGLANATTYAVSVVAVNAAGSSAAATASAMTKPAPVAPGPFTTGAHGAALVGRTVTITISGGGFYGQPTITSTEAGTRVGVLHDTGTLLTIHVTTAARERMGWHTLTIRLANGKTCKVNYDVK
ncbi:MAG: beta strand repeat-containing protein [Acidimicrobiales bacterium]